MTSIRKKGFTLIELMVVIAVIGILASIILSFLGQAKNESKNKKIMSMLRTAQSQAEFVYSMRKINPNTYRDICEITSIPDETSSMKSAGLYVNGAADTMGVPYSSALNDPGNKDKATCHSTSSAWAAEVPLLDKSGSFMWCVDNSGNGIKTTSNLGISDTKCD
jgi:type IV pilus assembly protein PilA